MSERKRWWVQPPVGEIITFDTWEAWVDDLFERGITNPGPGGCSIDPHSGLVTAWGITVDDDAEPLTDDEWNSYAEAAGFDPDPNNPKPRLSIINTADLIKKLAEATFEEFREGGGHDMGLWLDSGEINEDQYRYLQGLR
jgi:hypothetical protein